MPTLALRFDVACTFASLDLTADLSPVELEKSLSIMVDDPATSGIEDAPTIGPEASSPNRLAAFIQAKGPAFFKQSPANSQAYLDILQNVGPYTVVFGFTKLTIPIVFGQA